MHIDRGVRFRPGSPCVQRAPHFGACGYLITIAPAPWPHASPSEAFRVGADALRAILNASARAVGQTRAVLQADLILLLPGGVPRARHSFQRGDDVMSSRAWDVKFDTIKLNERPGAHRLRGLRALHHLPARDSCPDGLGLFRAGNSPLAPRARKCRGPFRT